MAKSKLSQKNKLDTVSRESNLFNKEMDPIIELVILKLVKITCIICSIILFLIIGGKIIMHYNL